MSEVTRFRPMTSWFCFCCSTSLKSVEPARIATSKCERNVTRNCLNAKIGTFGHTKVLFIKLLVKEWPNKIFWHCQKSTPYEKDKKCPWTSPTSANIISTHGQDQKFQTSDTNNSLILDNPTVTQEQKKTLHSSKLNLLCNIPSKHNPFPESRCHKKRKKKIF